MSSHSSSSVGSTFSVGQVRHSLKQEIGFSHQADDPALVRVDQFHQHMDPQEAGWTHCHSAVLFNRRESAPHKVEISLLPEDADKTFTILGFGYVP